MSGHHPPLPDGAAKEDGGQDEVDQLVGDEYDAERYDDESETIVKSSERFDRQR